MGEIRFENPEFLWMLVLIPLSVLWCIYTYRDDKASFHISTTGGFKGQYSLRIRLRPLLYILRISALTLLIVALTRPQIQKISVKSKTTRGIDIVMAIDESPSMLARDLKPNRMEALKKVAEEFVLKRPNDRIGVVVYSAESYTKVPVTSDKSLVLKAIRSIKYGELENGTAIGLGLATAVNRLKDSKAKSKIIILLTDGKNNAGFINPQTAATLAVEFGIKTYTIGVGTNGMARSPVTIGRDGKLVYDMVKVEIDETLLKDIANKTKGQYFRATDNKKLASIYDDIDKLEKSEIEEFKYYDKQDYYRPIVLLSAVFVLLEVLMRYTLFRSFI